MACARRMITDAEIARTLRKITPDDADNAILRLALEHQLVTRLTSLVAVASKALKLSANICASLRACAS